MQGSIAQKVAGKGSPGPAGVDWSSVTRGAAPATADPTGWCYTNTVTAPRSRIAEGVAGLSATVTHVRVGSTVDGVIPSGSENHVVPGIALQSVVAITADTPLSESLSEVGYWLVFLSFLPAVLGALAVDSMLAPVQNIVDTSAVMSG